MKVLFLIFLINSLLILLNCDDVSSHKILVNTKSPGKPLQKGVKLYNENKFVKLNKYYNYKELLKKKHAELDYFTVFPPIESVPRDIVGTLNKGRKSRVKKVLPDYGHSVFRQKRSAGPTKPKGKKVQPKSSKTRSRSRYSQRKGGKNKSVDRSNPKVKSKKSKKIVRKQSGSKIKSGGKKHVKRAAKKNIKKQKGKLAKKNKALPKNGKKNLGKSIGRGRKQKQSRTTTSKKKVGGRRLIASRDAVIEDYPYVVSIQKDRQHWCSGALLNQRLVITTANCIWKSNRLSRMRIRAGSRHYDQGGQTAKILEVAKHPRWSIRSAPDNDIGLILLDRNIKFSASVHSVDLPNKAMMPPFDDFWVTSWGAERRDGIFESANRPLQVYHAELLDYDKCNNVTLRFGVIVSYNFICLSQSGRRAPCTRDTGAPAVSDGILWGLASWGIRKLCGTERYPAMFSYVASPSNIDFITNATSYLMSEQRFYPFPDRFKVPAPRVTGPTTADYEVV